MKILFLGGGSGGHFYPMIAVARAARKIADEEHIVRVQMFFAADMPVDPAILAEENIVFIRIPAGKARRYVSWRYLIDIPKTIGGIIFAFGKLFTMMPDVIFSKGGYSAFPPLVAARILRIPVMVHESDAVPGVVNRWSGQWADRVAISFPESAKFFKNKYVALTGNPIRTQVLGGNVEEAVEFFGLEENIPTILVLGGSQGAEPINEVMLTILPEILPHYQIIHQTGEYGFDDVSRRAGVVLEKSEFKHRYHPYSFLKEGDLRNASRVVSLIISRAGASAIFEIAAWGVPALLIPLLSAAQDHQRENAYAYARRGGCKVFEQSNLTPHLLLSEIEKIFADKESMEKMQRAAQEFARIDAAEVIAREILKLGVHD